PLLAADCRLAGSAAALAGPAPRDEPYRLFCTYAAAPGDRQLRLSPHCAGPAAKRGKPASIPGDLRLPRSGTCLRPGRGLGLAQPATARRGGARAPPVRLAAGQLPRRRRGGV